MSQGWSDISISIKSHMLAKLLHDHGITPKGAGNVKNGIAYDVDFEWEYSSRYEYMAQKVTCVGDLILYYITCVLVVETGNELRELERDYARNMDAINRSVECAYYSASIQWDVIADGERFFRFVLPPSEALLASVKKVVPAPGTTETPTELFEIKDGELVFYHGTEKNVVVPDNVTVIGGAIARRAFANHKNLTGITIPDSVIRIESGVFAGCKKLTTVTLPSGITQIAGALFQGCGKLETITLPEQITAIGHHAFSGCKGLKTIRIPDSVGQIGSEAFEKCEQLTEINIPQGVTAILENTFKNCKKLSCIDIPEGVVSLGYRAFYGCEDLERVYLPASITEIKAEAFGLCGKLTVYASAGSYAQSYAMENIIPVQTLAQG